MNYIKVVDIDKTLDNLYRQLDKAEINRSELANLLGVSKYATYAWWYRKSLPTLDNLVIISGILKLNLDDLIITKVVEL